MRIRNVLTVLAIGTGLLLGTACRTTNSDGGGSEPVPEDELPDVIAEVVCTLLFDCECSTSHSDEMACDATFVADFTSAIEEGNAMMLTYDANCAGEWVGQFQGYQCDPFDSGGSYECSVCEVFHGDAADGEPCTSYSLGSGTYTIQGSTCAQGLWCDGSNCYDPCEDPNDYPGEGEPCPDFICDDGLFCPEGTQVCTAIPGNGEACPDYICDTDLWCNYETMMCEPGAATGEDCMTASCVSGNFCNSDFICTAYPGEGEDCSMSFVCAEGLQCTPDTMICEALPPAICSWG